MAGLREGKKKKLRPPTVESKAQGPVTSEEEGPGEEQGAVAAVADDAEDDTREEATLLRLRLWL